MLHACQACNQTTACTVDYAAVTPAVQETDDGSYVYLTTSLALIGSYRSHLSVFTQGGLHMLIYDNSDFSGLVTQGFVQTLARTSFNADFHSFFETQTSLWSVVLVGRFRHVRSCDTEIENRRLADDNIFTLTFTVESNLNVQVYIKNELAIEIRQDFGKTHIA